MRPLKMVCLAAVAAICLAALAGVGTASATALCKNNANTSSCNERYPVGTEFKTVLMGSATFEQSGVTLIQCNEASGEGKLEGAGGSTSTPWGKGTGTYGGCSCEVQVLKTGTIEVHHITGTDNGTVTFVGTEVTTSCPSIFGSVHCVYVTGGGADTGTLTGGNPASVTFNFVVSQNATSALCPSEPVLTAKFEITTPQPLYVAAS